MKATGGLCKRRPSKPLQGSLTRSIVTVSAP